MIIYVAGKMTGLENKGRARFNEAEKKLSDLGHIVLNPSTLPDGLTNKDYMIIGTSMIDVADAIYVLSGWESSLGTKLEIHYAEYTGKKVLFEGKDDEEL